MDISEVRAPSHAEGDNNLSARRGDWKARNLDDATRALVDADSRYFLHQSLSTPCISAIRKAEGIWLEDMTGRRFMDFHGNNVHHIGYGHPRLVEALKRQIDDLPFTPRRFTDEPAVALAAKLASITPDGLGKMLFATGGSDAIEMALKLARAVTGRFKTVSFWDAFHGAGFGASSIGGEEVFRSGPIGPLLPGTEHVAPPYCYRCPYGYRDIEGQPDLEACKTTCANFVRYVLEKEGDVAAVIAEPVRAVPYIPPPGFWRIVRQACDDHGALLIFDEIPAGLGKTGRMFACEHFGVSPDILVLGKALGGGIMPIAAMIAKPEFDVLATHALGHYTHEKNPVSCRAALTTIEIIEDEGLVENARIVGAHASDRLREMARRHSIIGDVRGLGLQIGVELVSDRDEKTPANDAAERILYAALDKGLSMKITMGNILSLTPPLTITIEEMDRALAIIDECLAEAGGN
jgi:4-aminobutyrate aminotransferase